MSPKQAVPMITRDFFASKVKRVVVVGSVKHVKRRSFIVPEEACGGGEKDHAYAKNVYRSCQDLKNSYRHIIQRRFSRFSVSKFTCGRSDIVKSHGLHENTTVGRDASKQDLGTDQAAQTGDL